MKTLESLIARYEYLRLASKRHQDALDDLGACFAALDLDALPRKPQNAPRLGRTISPEKVLNYLHDTGRCPHGIISVRDFYRDLHLTKASAWAVIDDLLEDGQIDQFLKPYKPGKRAIAWIGLPGTERMIQVGDTRDDSSSD